MIDAPTSLEAAEANRERMLKLLSFNRTDRGAAEALAYLHGHRLRFDHSRRCWRLYNGRFWAKDETGEADRAAVETARQLLQAVMQIEDPDSRKEAVGWAFGRESSYGRRAMLASAETIKSLATTAADYDRHPFLFNAANGTLDLLTGKLRASSPQDLITQWSGVPYHPEAVCPRWDRFLEEIFAGDNQLIGFVQRAVGYSLTGDVREQCLFLAHGVGSNGKSCFTELLLKLVGSYGAVTSFSTFLVHQNPGSPRNDIAKLHAARLVKAAESQRQAALDEATVKEVTGGDTISARYLFMEFFDFQPQFKIWVVTNHRPAIHGTDDAIWRRIRLIPFTQQFSGKQRDARLREKLEAELPGILAWAVRGCLEWTRIGLGNSQVVEQATTVYRRESDHLSRFLSERCIRGPAYQAHGRELFEAYVDWCSEKREKSDSNNIFAKTLTDRGVRKKRIGKGTVYLGVGLRPRTKQP